MQPNQPTSAHIADRRGGLYLEICRAARRSGAIRTVSGARRPKVTNRPLSADRYFTGARQAQRKCAPYLAGGDDPSEARKEAVREAKIEAERDVTFESFSKRWISETLAHPSATYRAMHPFSDPYIYPSISSKPLSEVKPRDVLAIIEVNKSTS